MFAICRIYVLIVFAVFHACGSTSDRDKKRDLLNQKYKLLYIQNFDNRSNFGGVTGRLKEKLLIAVDRDGRLKITPDKEQADLVLYGQVMLYGDRPSIMDNFSEPLVYNLTVLTSIKLRINLRKHSDEIKNDGVLIDQKLVRSDATFSPRQPPFETKFEAEETLLDVLANRIVMALFGDELD